MREARRNFFIFNFKRYFFCWAAGSCAAFFLSTEALIRWKVIPNDGLFSQFSLLNTSNALNAAFGDSHVANAFGGIPGFINLAYFGDSLSDVQIKLQCFYRGRRLGYVILPAEPQLFAHYNDGTAREVYKRFHLDNPSKSATLLMRLPYFHKQIPNYWKAFLENPAFHSRHPMAADGSYPEGGFIDPAAEEQGLFSRVEKLAPEEARLQGDPITLYHDILKELQANGATPCLVTYPVTEDFKGWSSRFPTYQKAESFFDATAKEYKVARVNLWKKKYPNTMFHDCDHINQAGMKTVSRDIVRECFPALRDASK